MKSRLSDVLDTIAAAVTAALIQAGTTDQDFPIGRVEVGWPNPNLLGKRMKAKKPLVTVIQTPRASGVNQFNGIQTYTVFPAPTCTATVASGEITIAGTVTPGLNVHVFTVSPEPDGYFATVQGDTPTTVAAKITDSINNLNYLNVVATQTGASVSVTDAPYLAVNIGSQGQGITETGRRNRDIQVSVWTYDDPSREAISNAILSALGTEDVRSLTLSDGSDFDIAYKSDTQSDSLEDQMTTYVSHIIFTVDYGVFTYTTATQIGSAITGLSLDSGPLSLAYDSGDDL